MNLKDLIYMALAFFTVKLLRKPMGKQATRETHKIPQPKKISDHAAPTHGNGIEPHFKPVIAKPAAQQHQKPVEEIARDNRHKPDIFIPFIPRKPEDIFWKRDITGNENSNRSSL